MTETSSGIWYVAICRQCEPVLPMPFSKADERSEWAAEHTAGTGHDVWMLDQAK